MSEWVGVVGALGGVLLGSSITAGLALTARTRDERRERQVAIARARVLARRLSLSAYLFGTAEIHEQQLEELRVDFVRTRDEVIEAGAVGAEWFEDGVTDLVESLDRAFSALRFCVEMIHAHGDYLEQSQQLQSLQKHAERQIDQLNKISRAGRRQQSKMEAIGRLEFKR